MNSKSVFKLVILLYTWIKITLFSLPITFAAVNLKQGKFQYGYDFFELNFNTAILLAFSLGLVFSIWNAFEFSNEPGLELKQFMKTNQRYLLKQKAAIGHVEMGQKIETFISENKRWKLLSSNLGSGYRLEVKNFLGARDVINITQLDNRWEIFSRPKWKIEIIDLARNLKNVKFISKEISV